VRAPAVVMISCSRGRMSSVQEDLKKCVASSSPLICVLVDAVLDALSFPHDVIRPTSWKRGVPSFINSKSPGIGVFRKPDRNLERR